MGRRTPAEKALLGLTSAGNARREAEELRAAALADIAAQVGPAREAGLTVAQIMEATGLARASVYKMLERRTKEETHG